MTNSWNTNSFCISKINKKEHWKCDKSFVTKMTTCAADMNFSLTGLIKSMNDFHVYTEKNHNFFILNLLQLCLSLVKLFQPCNPGPWMHQHMRSRLQCYISIPGLVDCTTFFGFHLLQALIIWNSRDELFLQNFPIKVSTWSKEGYS